MNARDLRIGNIVFDKSRSEHDFEKLGNGIYRVSSHAIERFDAGFMDLKPVPLTSEWLERFGFQLITDGGDLIGNDRYWVGPALIGCLSLPNFQHSTSGVTVRTIHQLQNLYFALTGSELQLKDKTV